MAGWLLALALALPVAGLAAAGLPILLAVIITVGVLLAVIVAIRR